MEWTRECPRRSVTQASRDWINLFHHYRNHLLLRSGGIADQPHAYLEAMQLIDMTIKQDHANTASKV